MVVRIMYQPGSWTETQLVTQDHRPEFILNRRCHSLFCWSTREGYSQWEAAIQPQELTRECLLRGGVEIERLSFSLHIICRDIHHIWLPALSPHPDHYWLSLQNKNKSFDWPGIYLWGCLDQKEEELGPSNSCPRELRDTKSDSLGDGYWDWEEMTQPWDFQSKYKMKKAEGAGERDE